MCGIVYCESLKGRPVNRLVQEIFQAQRSRGTEGFGLYDLSENKLVRATKERKMMSWVKNHKSDKILFHHRFPTSTDNVKNACHPFSTKDFFKTNYIMVHNGYLYNHSMLKSEHDKLGISYHSLQRDGRFNDSETLLWDLALYLDGKQDKIASRGAIAFVCIAIKDNKRKLYFARNSGSPLKMHKSNRYFTLSSEGTGKMIDTDTLYCYDYATRKLTTKPLKLTDYTYYGSGYSSGYSNSYYPYQNSMCLPEPELNQSDDVVGANGKLVDVNALSTRIKETYKRIMLRNYGYYAEAIGELEDEKHRLYNLLEEVTPSSRDIVAVSIEVLDQVISVIESDPQFLANPEDAYDKEYFDMAIERDYKYE